MFSPFRELTHHGKGSKPLLFPPSSYASLVSITVHVFPLMFFLPCSSFILQHLTHDFGDVAYEQRKEEGKARRGLEAATVPEPPKTDWTNIFGKCGLESIAQGRKRLKSYKEKHNMEATIDKCNSKWNGYTFSTGRRIRKDSRRQ